MFIVLFAFPVLHDIVEVRYDLVTLIEKWGESIESLELYLVSFWMFRALVSVDYGDVRLVIPLSWAVSVFPSVIN